MARDYLKRPGKNTFLQIQIIAQEFSFFWNLVVAAANEERYQCYIFLGKEFKRTQDTAKDGEGGGEKKSVIREQRGEEMSGSVGGLQCGRGL